MVRWVPLGGPVVVRWVPLGGHSVVCWVPPIACEFDTTENQSCAKNHFCPVLNDDEKPCEVLVSILPAESFRVFAS